MLEGKRIILTGAPGFLGRHIMQLLYDAMKAGCGPRSLFLPTHKQFDLTIESEVQRMYENAACGPDTVVIHCAAECGGIGLNQLRPGRLFYANLMMNTLLMEHAVWNKVGKYVAIGSICSYPKHLRLIPFDENELWYGYPEETNAAYGMAKKMQIVQAEANKKQYGFNAINLMLANLYGPGDSYDPDKSHVIPAIIAKMEKAKRLGSDKVILWGSGLPTRDFLYVGDAAEAVALAADTYNDSYPINIGTGVETFVQEIADKIRQLVGFTGKIVWDVNQPNGQPRRVLDVTQARVKMGWQAKVGLEAGLEATVGDYVARYGQPQ